MDHRCQYKMQKYKTLEETMVNILPELIMHKFFIMTTYTWLNRRNKLMWNKIKHSVKDNDKRMKMKIQVTDWAKEFLNHISNRGLVSNLYKEFLNNNKIQLGNGKKV